MFITQDFGAFDLPEGAENFRSIIEADEEDRFKVKAELKQPSVTTINHNANSIIPHIKLT